MIVLDASAAVDWLLQTPIGSRIGNRIFSHGESLHAPHLLDVEVTQVLRRSSLAATLSAVRAYEALQDFLDLRIQRYPHDVLLPRVWQMRHNLTAYDGVYVALAEQLDAVLVTRDHGLASASGHAARVELY